MHGLKVRKVFFFFLVLEIEPGPGIYEEITLSRLHPGPPYQLLIN